MFKKQLATYDNKLNHLHSKKTELIKKIHNIEQEIDNCYNQKRDCGIIHYLNKDFRNSLLTEAEELGYSPDKINELSPYLNEWNQDCVTNDVIDSFRNLEDFIKNNQKSYRKTIPYKLSKFLNSERNNSNEN